MERRKSSLSADAPSFNYSGTNYLERSVALYSSNNTDNVNLESRILSDLGQELNGSYQFRDEQFRVDDYFGGISNNRPSQSRDSISGMSGDAVDGKKQYGASGRQGRITLKLDVSFTDHSHIIGKAGRSIQRVMNETNTHIHFPDSNRTNTFEKSNQVSVAGTAFGAEQARCRIRDLLPLTVCFDIPITNLVQAALDSQAPIYLHVQRNYGLVISLKSVKDESSHYSSYVAPSSGTVRLSVRGTRSHVLGFRQGVAVLLEQITGGLMNFSSAMCTLETEVAAQHHSFVMGRGNANIRSIMANTGVVVKFPEPMTIGNAMPAASSLPMKRSTVTIIGSSFDTVFSAWQELLGYLPLMLIFDLREGQDIDAAQITQLMERLKVSILIKPKQKQNLKSIMIRGPEKDSRMLFEVRRQIMGLDETEVPICCEKHNTFSSSFPAVSAMPPTLPSSSFALRGLAPQSPDDSSWMSQLLKYRGEDRENIFYATESSRFNDSIYADLPSGWHDVGKHYSNGLSNYKYGDAVDTSPSEPSPASSESTPPTASTATSETVSNGSRFSFDHAIKERNNEECRAFQARKKPLSNSVFRTPTTDWSSKGFSKSCDTDTLTMMKQAFAFRTEEKYQKHSLSSIWSDSPDDDSLHSRGREALMPRHPTSTSNGNLGRSILNASDGLAQSRMPPPPAILTRKTNALDKVDLTTILTEMGFAHFLDHFEGTSFIRFLSLDEKDLLGLGIKQTASRAKLLQLIRQLQGLFKGDTSDALRFDMAPGAERTKPNY